MSATQPILDFAAAEHRLPDQVRRDALRLLGDTLAVGAAGAGSGAAAKLVVAIREFGRSGPARLLGGASSRVTGAAFFNGFAVHCLEWDAVHEKAVVHALSVVAAALLAQSDKQGGSDPEQFLTALAVGVDIASGLGIAATGPMKFFRPATAGVIGAALACARIAGVPRDRFADVLGLAYSFAGGTMQAHVEASIALPLQIANAARSAVTAASLVEAGMDGPHDVLEGSFGYAHLIEPLDLGEYVAGLGTVWRISEVATKPFPSGRASHGALGELQALHRGGLRLGDVERVELRAPPLIGRLVGRAAKPDMTPAYARLCLAILAPMMLRDGIIDPAHFREEGLRDPALLCLADRVSVTLDGNPDENALGPQGIVVTLRDGTVIERTIAANLGSLENPMTDEQSAQKLALCRRLAPEHVDPRIFADPLSYAAEPR